MSTAGTQRTCCSRAMRLERSKCIRCPHTRDDDGKFACHPLTCTSQAPDGYSSIGADFIVRGFLAGQFLYPQCPDTWPRSRGRRSPRLQTLEIGMERAIDHCAMYCSGTQHLLRCEKPSDYREHFFRCHRVDSCCRKERSKGLFTDVLHPTLAFERFELGGEFLAQIRSARGIRL